MLDLGFDGHPFTWSNGREEIVNIQARLDRALGIPEFRNKFSPIKITHLPHFRSDLAIILIHLEASLGRHRCLGPKNFILEETCSHEANCEESIRRFWK